MKIQQEIFICSGENGEKKEKDKEKKKGKKVNGDIVDKVQVGD